MTEELKSYIGVKEIDARQMNLGDYNRYRGWQILEDEDPEKEGYLVVYPDGYESWSPKQQFDDAYRRIDNGCMTFGLAIEALRKGSCIARIGWNGKGMFICKQVPAEINANIIPKMQSLPQSAKDILHEGDDDTRPIFYVNQMIIVNTKTRSIDSWVASSSDTFAEDWIIVK